MVNICCEDNEWIRRRQTRIMQVRKQSNDIAKRLRERVINEERQRRLEVENELQHKLNIWKVRRLNNLEEMYRKAISEFGAGHKIAAEELSTNKEMEEKQKEYLYKAIERGETAMEMELKEKREAAEKKQIPIQRKIITRKIEDLRSSLICSIPLKESSAILRDTYAEKPLSPKQYEPTCKFKEPIQKNSQQEEKLKVNEVQNKSSSENVVACGNISPGKQKTRKKIEKKMKSKSGVMTICDKYEATKFDSPRSEKLWVNLGAIEMLSEKEGNQKDGRPGIQVKRSGRDSRGEKEKDLKCDLKKEGAPKNKKGGVECYGYSFRHSCPLKDNGYSVQRMINRGEPNAIELALEEEEKMLQERKERENRKITAEERGNRAIEKEKISRNYNELLAKLEKLSTREKIIKSFCHIPPAHLFFSDERRREISARKQKVMDSEFERIYYDVIKEKPDGYIHNRIHLEPFAQGIKNDIGPESLVTKLDFSKLDSNLRTNSPTSSGRANEVQEKSELNRIRSPVEKVSIKKTPSSLHFKRTKIVRGDKKTLSDIDKILKRSRKLRQDSQRNAEFSPGDECSQIKSQKQIESDPETENISSAGTGNGSIELDLCKSDSLSPNEGNRVSDILFDLKNSPDGISSIPRKTIAEDLAMGDVPRNLPGVLNKVIAWPVHELKQTKRRSGSPGRSSSTSYRSLPSEINPKRINSLIKVLGQLKEREGSCTIADELIVELEKLLNSLVDEVGENNLNLSEEDCHEFQSNPLLRYYITKLLDMSRERIAALSVTSESEASLAKLPDFCNTQKDGTQTPTDNKYLKETNENSRSARIKRAKQLEAIIKKWKLMLEQNLNCPSTGELNQVQKNEAKRTSREKQEKRKSEDKYEEVSKKCSDRMAVLSDILGRAFPDKGNPNPECREKGRKLDEDLKTPKSGLGHVCQRPEDINHQKYKKWGNRERPRSPRKLIIDYCDDRTCPFLMPPNVDPINYQQAGAPGSVNDSLESFPNVMEELLKKKIITSPFHWSRGKPLSDFSPQGSRCSGKSRSEAVHGEVNDMNEMNMPAENCDYGGQECPKLNVTNFWCRRNKCKDSCKGSCAAKILEGRKVHHKNLIQENVPNCKQQFPTQNIKGPRKVQGPLSHLDAAYGLFSPIARDKCSRDPRETNESPEMYHLQPEEMFKKRTFGSRRTWDENKGEYEVNPGARPAIGRQFWKHQVQRPNSSKISCSSGVNDPRESPKRRRSSPLRKCEREAPREGYHRRANPNNILSFEEETYDPHLRDLALDAPRELFGDDEVELRPNPYGSGVHHHPPAYFHEEPVQVKELSESVSGIMQEWIRRNMASEPFHQLRGNELDGSCAGSCALHCNNAYATPKQQLRPRSSSSVKEGSGRVAYQRPVNSSPDMRKRANIPFSNVRATSFSNYCQNEEYEEVDSEESCDFFGYLDPRWAEDLLGDLEES